MKAHLVSAATVCAAFLLAACGVLANPKEGNITGHVRDTKGKPLARIPVEIMQTGEFVFTDKDGGYLFVEEYPGVYSLSADGQVTPLVTTRTQVTLHSRVILSFTLVPASHAVCDFILKPLGTKWISPHPSPILREYSGPKKAQQSSPEGAWSGNVFGGDSGLHSAARSR